MTKRQVGTSPRTSPRSAAERERIALAVGRVGPVVQGVLRRVLGANDPEYEDVLQSSLEQVLPTLEGAMCGEGPLFGAMLQWAAVVTRNVAIDALRARSRERRLLSYDQDVALESFAAGADPERLACARERLAQFASALTGLQAGHADVVYRHDVLGHRLTEIAVALGISVAAAQSRLVRGRRRIAPRRGSPDVVPTPVRFLACSDGTPSRSPREEGRPPALGQRP